MSTPATRLRLLPVKLEDLQEILAKMTPRPWRWNGEQMLGPECLKTDERGKEWDDAETIIETDSNVYPPREHDAAGILALVNNADALLELVSTLREMFKTADSNGWCVGGMEKRHAPDGEGPLVLKLRRLMGELDQ